MDVRASRTKRRPSTRNQAFRKLDLAKAAASILGDEAMHWAIVRQALGEAPVPAAFMS